MILMIDNYDSFTYNVVDYVKRFEEVVVYRNDEVESGIVSRLKPRGILISPGPGRPSDSGVSYEIVERYYKDYPILGICLGHQLIGELFGGNIVRADRPMHGKTSLVYHQSTSLFSGLPNPIRVMRYHSLLIQAGSLPKEFEVTAQTIGGEIMGIQHKMYNLAGVQFHPESILSDYGEVMIRHWINSLSR